MKGKIWFGSALLAAALGYGTARGEDVNAKRPDASAPEKPRAEAKAPQVEVVFVLDTTGSMGGLLEGAKKKIWAIASEIARGQPKPEVKVGLVAYRDKGDAYVTKVHGLTDDLDRVYSDLKTFQPGGGGDTPENVRAALKDALGAIQWSQDPATLKIVFLVGDAPPHMDYQDVPTIEELCSAAIKKGVIINTIRCGQHAETGRIWREIALKSEGKFLTIDHDGGVVTVASPYDEELGKLNDDLSRTFVAYGSADERRKAGEREAGACAPAAPAEDKAARADAKARLGRYSADDLVDAVREGRVALEKLEKDSLPEEMKDLSPEKRKAFLEERSKKREEIRARILELSKKRDAFCEAEAAKKGKDSFDRAVVDALREQAARKGITYEK